MQTRASRSKASQLSVDKKKLWSRRALFTSEAGGRFTDKDFHAYLRQQGVVRETTPSVDRVASLRDRAEDVAGVLPRLRRPGFLERPERRGRRLCPASQQQAAVDQAVAAFEAGKTEVLWNAKPRFS